MLLTPKSLVIILSFVTTLIYCDHAEVDGVVIEHNLYENLTLSKQTELKELVRLTLNKDVNALTKIINFWCGGAAGCYDLGFVITQIVFRLGEDEFIKMVVKLDRERISELVGLISAGLEYGDNNKDGKMDKKKIENEFPKLYKALAEKHPH